jgi:hypothetical protein
MNYNNCLKDHGYNFGGIYYAIFCISTKIKSQSHGNKHSSTRVSSISKKMMHAYWAYYSSTIVNDRSHPQCSWRSSPFSWSGDSYFRFNFILFIYIYVDKNNIWMQSFSSYNNHDLTCLTLQHMYNTTFLFVYWSWSMHDRYNPVSRGMWKVTWHVIKNIELSFLVQGTWKKTVPPGSTDTKWCAQ